MHTKVKSGPGPETEKYGFLFTTKYAKPPAHKLYMYMRPPILAVTLHAAVENGSTVPAGCPCCMHVSLFSAEI